MGSPQVARYMLFPNQAYCLRVAFMIKTKSLSVNMAAAGKSNTCRGDVQCMLSVL